jgi:predicted PurR-regulated permease PerM
VLFATVGGLATLGVSGFVAGPVLAALFVVSWQMLDESLQG